MKTKILPILAKDILFFLILGSVALPVGILINQMHAHPLPLIYESKVHRLERSVANLAPARIDEAKLTATSSATQEIPKIDLQEFKEALAGAKALVVDARPEIFHRLGHIPGAVSLPRDDFEAFYAKKRKNLELYKDKRVVIYCSGDTCEDSKLVGYALTRIGFKKLEVFAGGWNQWREEHLPEEKE
jgi:predicted sulfurtransferase